MQAAPTPEPAPRAALAPRQRPPAQPEPEEVIPDIDLLIRDLANDNVPGNARRAKGKLEFILNGRRRGRGQRDVITPENVNAYNMREVCKERLRLALFSLDYQQRQLAANILIRCLEGPFPVALDAVLVESLRYDTIDLWTCHANNEADATHFFLKNPEVLARSAHLLQGALSSGDGQQRFLAACILCRSPHLGDPKRVCSLLFEHLADNDIPGDAKMATQALCFLDYRALPLIEDELALRPDSQADRQLRYVRRVILSRASKGAARARDERYPKIYWDAKMSR